MQSHSYAAAGQQLPRKGNQTAFHQQWSSVDKARIRRDAQQYSSRHLCLDWRRTGRCY
ncbi:MAG: hypothetical protein PHW10_03280 [Candidatus Peribacteraceae bacterium]|nr:hypothetical protein [Candidatus Peribacteraceae bacterium]